LQEEGGLLAAAHPPTGDTIMRARALLPLAGLLAAACQPLPRHQVNFGFERGGALTEAEYARLEPLARAQVTEVVDRAAPSPDARAPHVTYVFAFRPNFDPKTITRVGVGPFAAEGSDEARIAAELPGELLEILTKRGLPATVGSTEPFTISGTVTRAPAPDVAAMHTVVETQVEARIAQGGTTVGVMQANSAALHTNITGGAPTMLLGSLISRAIQPSRVSVLAGTIADALLRARTGEREVAYSNRALPRAAAEPATGSGIAAAATR